MRFDRDYTQHLPQPNITRLTSQEKIDTISFWLEFHPLFQHSVAAGLNDICSGAEIFNTKSLLPMHSPFAGFTEPLVTEHVITAENLKWRAAHNKKLYTKEQIRTRFETISG